MHSRFSSKALAAVALASALFALPQPGMAQGVLESCGAQIEQYCADVLPGDGRIAACLYAHENYLDEGCANAISDVGDILDHLFSTIREAVATCAPDIEKQCAGVEFGGGRIMSCLQEKSAGIAPECKSVVDQFAKALAPQ